MDGPETHSHAHHSSGHRLFDFIVSGSAVLISCVSLFIAVQHGRTMERLVESNSYPNVELGGAVSFTDKPDELALGVEVENTGVGPARVETIELWENGKPLRSASDIGAAIKAVDGAHYVANIEGGNVLESLIGAGKKRTFIRFKLAGVQKWFPTLSKVLFGLESRVCYCSVFDECHVSDTRVEKGRPKSVKQCPTPPVPYDDNFSDLAFKSAVSSPSSTEITPANASSAK